MSYGPMVFLRGGHFRLSEVFLYVPMLWNGIEEVFQFLIAQCIDLMVFRK